MTAESGPVAAVPEGPRPAAAVAVLELGAEAAEVAEVAAAPEGAEEAELAEVAVAAEVEEELPAELRLRDYSLAAAEAPPAATPDCSVCSALPEKDR